MDTNTIDPMRLLISEGTVTHITPKWVNGQLVTTKHVLRGPVSAISTTTKNRLKIDDETRHISIWCLASTILSLQRQLEFPTDYADSFSPSIFSLLSMPEMSLLLAGPERSPSWAERRACQQQRAADPRPLSGLRRCPALCPDSSWPAPFGSSGYSAPE